MKKMITVSKKLDVFFGVIQKLIVIGLSVAFIVTAVLSVVNIVDPDAVIGEGFNTVDIGMAQLAMHSPLETAGARDTEQLICALRVFFGARLHTSAGGTFALAFS